MKHTNIYYYIRDKKIIAYSELIQEAIFKSVLEMKKYYSNDKVTIYNFIRLYKNDLTETETEGETPKKKKVNKTYAELKAEKRQEAIDIQNEIANESLSYGGMAIISDYLEKIGKRYGLLKEFRENGLI